MGVSIDHICLLVKDIEATKRLYKDILGLEPYNEREENRGTPAAFKAIRYKVGEVILQIMAPTGPDATMLNKTIAEHGEGFHHFCFGVDDMKPVVEKCNNLGIRLVTGGGKPIKDGATNGYADPRMTQRTLTQFIKRGEEA